MQDGTILEPDYLEVAESHHGARAASKSRQKSEMKSKRNGAPQEHAKPDGGNFRVTGQCAVVSGLLSRIGDKWSVLIVALLGNHKMRFSELRREIDGISQKMLTSTLRSLERDGFVERTVYPTIPPKVEYELTALGEELLVPISGLAEWAIANAKRVDAAREKFDASRKSAGQH